MLVDVAITIYSMHFIFSKESTRREKERESFSIKQVFLILNPLKFQMKDAKNNGHSHKTIACH